MKTRGPNVIILFDNFVSISSMHALDYFVDVHPVNHLAYTGVFV